MWTHDLVLERIGGALKAVVLTAGRVGPEIYSAPWPATVRSLPPLAELEQWLEVRREFEQAIHQRLQRPSAEEIALADEALAWPVKYLRHQPLQRDAVWLTGLCLGLNLKLEKMLRRRRLVADRMVEIRKGENPDIIRIYEDDAGDAAAKIAHWANKALAAGGGAARARRIRQGARILFVREIRKVKAVERVTVVRRSDVMPGKLFNQSRVHHHRILGVEAILAGLEADGVKER